MSDDWECEAYGDGGRAVDAMCFFAAPGQRACHDPGECATRLTAERQRVFAAIQRGAEAGHPVMQELAEHFSHPDQLLGGPAAAEDGGETDS